ncbi:MAG: NADAR family protein, partial [Patescibacteria group bacterium]
IMYPASSNELNRETESEVYFFTPAFYPLDNFSAHGVRIWGRDFPTAEHAFQWKKFSESNPAVAERIFHASSPHIAKEIANANTNTRPQDWIEKRVSVMEEILRAKAAQHEDVRSALERTGTRTIKENSPVDLFWGIGPNGTGDNTLGVLWMKIRVSGI